MKMTPQQIKDGLKGFYCTDGYTRYTFGILLTSGVKWLCDAAQSYWLVDAIGSWQLDKRVRNDEMLQEFQFWMLKVNREPAPEPMTVGAVLAAKTQPKPMAQLILKRDKDDVVLTQNIEYTDFPLDEIELYYSPQDKVLLLPSEY